MDNEVDPEGPGRARARWLTPALLTALVLGAALETYLTVAGLIGGSGARFDLSLRLRFAQAAVYPNVVETSPLMFVPAVLLVLLSTNRGLRTPVPGPQVRRAAAVLMGVVAAWSLLQAVGFLWWLVSADDVERASIGSPDGGWFFVLNGLVIHVWSALVGGTLGWCLVRASPPEPAGSPADDPGPEPELDLDRFRRPS